MNTDFHHFGLAVRAPDDARKFLSNLGYRPAEYVFDPAQNVHLQICYHCSQPPVEIIWPGDTPGPVNKLVQRHPAGVIYHVCYITDKLAELLADWEAAGVTVACVSPPTPALLFKGRKVSFYNVAGIGLVEILENEG